MSERMARVLPGFFPRSVATTPCPPTPVRTSSPIALSRRATNAAVSGTSAPVSGC